MVDRIPWSLRSRNGVFLAFFGQECLQPRCSGWTLSLSGQVQYPYRLARSRIQPSLDVLFTNGAHSNCISLTSVGIFGWKEFHICRAFLYFESYSLASGVFEQKNTWKAMCTKSTVCDLIMQILSSWMCVQAESCRKRVLLQASNKDTISIHSQSSLLKCFCKCSIHGVGMCFVGG